MTAAFPELALYVVTRAENKFGQTDISSGVTSQDEYLRTVGALFCVYWLARIGIDGERGFSFGVDNDWTPRPIPTPSTEGGALEGDAAKRKKFHDNCDWRLLQQARATIRAIRRNSAPFGAIRRNSAQFGAIRRNSAQFGAIL